MTGSLFEVWDICGQWRRGALVHVTFGACFVSAGVSPAFCQPPPDVHKHDSFIATAYSGRAFDTFAPDEMGCYPPNTDTTPKNRALFGVDFDYRLAGSLTEGWQFWLAGETLHGVRSADISCGSSSAPPRTTSGKVFRGRHV